MRVRDDHRTAGVGRPRRAVAFVALGTLLVMGALVAPVVGQGGGEAFGPAVAAAKAQQRPARVTKVRAVPYTFLKPHSVRVRWMWEPDVATYRIQLATDKKFTQHRRSVRVKV